MNAVTRSGMSGYKWFFLIAAIYDIALGAAFLVASGPLLSAIGMPPPSHIGYVQLAAIFIFIQGLGYWLVYRDPPANLGLVRMGVAYKAGYAGLTAFYLLTGQLPSLFFIPWAVIDAAFLVGFVMFLRFTATPRPG